MQDLVGQLWARKFAIEDVNILFLAPIDREDFHASSAKEWKVLIMRPDSSLLNTKMVIIADELGDAHWIRIS